MRLSAFTSSFLYEPGKPRFRDYPTFLDGDDTTLPGLEASLDQIGEYQRRLWANQSRAVLLVTHGPDTSGKDSLIRTLATYADPAGFHAWSFRRPRGAETRHDFLWRVTPVPPGSGQRVASNRRQE